VHLTRESEYALLALSYLVDADGGSPVSAAEIAEARELPMHFLAKILQKLGRAGILEGGRGRGRGYTLAQSAARITIGDVLEAVEPAENIESCLLWQGYCGDANPCPLHHRLKSVHRQIRTVLGDISLAEYVRDGRHRDIRDA
jgi:Rrf2 family protein